MGINWLSANCNTCAGRACAKYCQTGTGARAVMAKSGCRSALAVAVAVIVSGAGSVAAKDDGLSDFVETYQCSLAGLIAKIEAYHGKSDEQNRFIIQSLHGPPARYVQCAFDNREREGLCEASSGWWNNSWEQPHIGTAERAALARLGFSTDGSHGNFQQPLHVPPGGPEPYALASLMLSVLYDVYGARKDVPIEVEAPFALRHGFLPRQRCVPIS